MSSENHDEITSMDGANGYGEQSGRASATDGGAFGFDLSLDIDEALGVAVPAPEEVKSENDDVEQEEQIEERGVDGIPLVDAPVPESKPDATIPAYDRIKRLIAEMGSQRKTLLAMIAACEQPLSSAAMIELVEDLQRYNKSVYSPSDLCNLLRRDGALELVNEDGTPYVEEQEPQVVQVDENGVASPVATDECKCRSESEQASELGVFEGSGAEELPCEGGAQASANDQAPDAGELQDSDSDSDTIADGEHVALEPAKPAERYWLATPDGLRVVRENDPSARLEALFEDEGLYLPIYKCLLALCARDGGARTPALSAAVNDHELLQHPRYYVTRFLDRLERCEAIEWRGSWVATSTGLAGLEQMGDVEDIEVAQDIDEAQEVRFGYYTNEDLDALQA